MSLDLSAVGYETQPFFFEYDWKIPALAANALFLVAVEVYGARPELA
jgi:hypothetical protein